MASKLKGLFGGGDKEDDDHRAQTKDFVNRYMEGDPTEGYSSEEAASVFRNAMGKASPESIQRAAQQAVSRLNPDQRAEFAEMLKQRQAGKGGVTIQRAGDDGGGSPRGGGGEGGGDLGLDDLLGGLLGGGAMSGGSGGGGGGLGDILGGVLGGMGGGQASADAGVRQGDGGDGDGMAGGLGDLLGSPVGKAVLGGIAAFAMKEMFDND